MDRQPFNFDPRLLARRGPAAAAANAVSTAKANAGLYWGAHWDSPADANPGFLTPGRGPVASPVSMPGPGPGGGGYNRYREMTLEEMLLENRTLFLVGEINHVSASR